MSQLLLNAAGRRRSPAAMPDFPAGRPPPNKGQRYSADPPTVEELVSVMRHAGEGRGHDPSHCASAGRKLVCSGERCRMVDARDEDGKPPDPQDALEVYRVHRAQVEHEDTLLGVRVGWLIAAESFLFAAYAATLAVSEQAGDTRFVPAAGRLFTLLPILGIVTSVLVLSAIAAGIWATFDLRKNFRVRVKQLPPYLPPVEGETRTHYLGLVSPIAMPIVIVAVWSMLLVE